MREAYKRSQGYLQTMGEPDAEEKNQEVFRRSFLRMVGYTEEEIQEMNITEMEDQDFSELVRRRFLGMTKNGSKQEVIPVEDIEDYITKGWEYVATLPTGKAVIRQPTNPIPPIFSRLSPPG